jgi:tetratricopeptide (TPR) repeat protein
MKLRFYLFCPFLVGGAAMALLTNTSKKDTVPVPSAAAVSCAPATAGDFVTINGKYIPVMPGWGNHSYRITTGSDSAQFYFNQGLTFYYSYHAREAVASFKEAARFDSTSAMAYWGQALALGPSYNFGFAYKMNERIPAILEAMNRHAREASAKEKALIAAMNQRYNSSDPADGQRVALNARYAEALKPLVHTYADDIDIKALYTDAVMLLHAWDFWYNDGRPKAWTPELAQYCKDILQKDPRHPAALHYYIHVTEASRQPEVALPGADSLLRLFPGVAHMVHMSSHEYERIGFYARGVDANEKADRSLVVYDSLAKGLLPQVHVPHYYAVDAYCALSGAMQQKALAKSLVLRNSVQPTAEATYLQYQYMFPQLAMVRLGKWNELLQDSTPIDTEWRYAQVLSHFAKGMALAKTGRLSQAESALQQLRETMKDETLRKKFVPHSSSPAECAVVAENILQATLFFERQEPVMARSAMQKAIRAEDSLLYAEPKIWMLPARQYLGAFLLQLKQPGEAEKVYREDLVWNPGNGWSLLGLYQALQAQGEKSDLAALKKKYTASFSAAEKIPERSAY